ncbi:MAG TPA: hypothetical protein VHB98_20130 [Chloroflexota bacterium]|nr:hypothetical protein [Chloroflexota bacterium]
MAESAPQEPATPMVGSAEPLNREQTVLRLRELEAWGVDLSLVRYNLQRTPEQRIAQNEDMARLVRELQIAVRRGQGKPLAPNTGIHRMDHP